MFSTSFHVFTKFHSTSCVSDHTLLTQSVFTVLCIIQFETVNETIWKSSYNLLLLCHFSYNIVHCFILNRTVLGRYKVNYCTRKCARCSCMKITWEIQPNCISLYNPSLYGWWCNEMTIWNWYMTRENVTYIPTSVYGNLKDLILFPLLSLSSLTFYSFIYLLCSCVYKWPLEMTTWLINLFIIIFL